MSGPRHEGVEPGPSPEERELVALRQRVAELQRRLAFYSESGDLVRRSGGLEVSISEREALLVEAERISHVGSWIWNLETNQVDWSDELFRILGYDPAHDPASTEAFFAAVHPDDVERVRETSARGIAAGICEQVVFRVRHRDGMIRHVVMDGSLLFDDRGTLRRVVGTVIDITEAREAERRLAAAHAALEEAQAIARVGSFTFPGDGGAPTWSAELCRLLESGDEAPSRDLLLSRIHPEDRPAISELLAGGRPQVSAEARITRRDGSQAIAKITALSKGPGGGETIQGTLQDVTEHRALEAQLARSQRTEAIGRLAGGVAHDLNNHLMIMRGNLELLELERSPELEGVLAAIGAAERLTARLLAFGRRSQLRKRRLDVNAVVQRTIALIEGVIGEDIELAQELTPGLPPVEADEDLLGQCLVNLLLNARDALPKGGRIAVATRTAPEGLVEISVADDGHGMDEATRARIFEPFFTTKPEGKGTGLGLSMVQGTVAQHGGSIKVTSTPGLGSAFSLLFPSVEPGPEVQQAVAESPGTPPRPTSILLVEDQAPVSAVVARILRTAGHRVWIADRPSHAIDLFRELAPEIELVLSDVVMPEMRGPAMIEEMARTSGRVPRVIYMSGYSPDVLELAGGAVVLPKPFGAADLTRAVLAALE